LDGLILARPRRREFELMGVVAANAGVAETINIAKPLAAGAPPKPLLKTIDVNLYGPIYSAYLAIHYFRTNSPATGGRYVVTSSSAGLYGTADLPLYCSAKFGCVGLVRSLGMDKRMRKEGITFNAICPGWVETGLAPPGMIDFVRKTCPEIITPMNTVMKAYNMFIDSDMTAQAVECTGELAEPRPQPEVLPFSFHILTFSPLILVTRFLNRLQRVRLNRRTISTSQRLGHQNRIVR
jgi:15-hydroxyprostaglandin dehydrogenase (NAD)